MRHLIRHPIHEIRTHGLRAVLTRPSVQRPLVWVLALLVVGVLWQDNREQSNDIQHSREEAVRRTCDEQNTRHDATIKKLDDIIAGLPEGARKTRAEQNRAGTVLLINALAPKRDCAKAVELVR